MEAISKVKNLRVSPRKLRLLVDAVRGKQVDDAINSLRFSNKRMSVEVINQIRSAVNNATAERSVDSDNLYVKQIYVDGGPTMKRFLTRARGSASRILKRLSHLTVVVDEKEPVAKAKKAKGKE